MTESKDEMEIVSTLFDSEDNGYCLSTMREADNRARNIAKNIIRLKETLICIQKRDGITKSENMEVCGIKKQLAELVDQYKVAINQVMQLAKMLNFNTANLECQKIDIDQTKKENTPKCEFALQTEKDNDDEIAPVIMLNNDLQQRNMVLMYQNNNETKCVENDVESLWSCNDESEHCSNCVVVEDNNEKHCCSNSTDDDDTDEYEKEAIRDDLMSMKGEVKLLHQQNRELLNKLNSANKRTFVLTNALRNKPPFAKCKTDGLTENNEKKSNTALLLNEVSRLRKELKESERDRCQIELARKILNVSNAQCVGCVGSPCKSDLKRMTADCDKLSLECESKTIEISKLRDALDGTKCGYKSYENRLMVADAQIVQLERELFELTSAKTNDRDVTCSNDKYMLDNLRNRLQEVTEEKTNMQMVLDFHLSELEDKKLKYMEVLQINQEQKHRIETLCKEKTTFAREYELEFNRMSEHLKARLEEIGTLPGMLATAQKNLEKEKLDRVLLENELQSLTIEINTLRKTLANAELVNNENKLLELEQENTQLRATVKTLRDTMAENDRLYRERTHYSLQLKDHLDAVREEAAIQVTKTKDFSECQRNNYTDYIQKLELQLAECRAVACSEHKKRDHIDERLRHRIELLTKNLNDAHKKIEDLMNAKHFIEAKMGEELCKLPLTIKRSCEDINRPKRTVKSEDNSR